MNERVKRYGIVCLLAFSSLAGCRHKALPPPPPAAQAPPITPSSITVITPLPSVPPQSKADVQPARPEQPAPQPVAKPVKRPRRLRRKPSTVDSAQASGADSNPAPTPAAAGGAPGTTTTTPAGTIPAPGTSTAEEAAPALGQLSAGTAISSAERTRILGEIQVQETRLLKVKTSGSADVLAMQVQIRTFLAKARQAVAENDLDGAQTLNTKARVLLDELQGE
jgi:hypothetical protein